MLCAILHLSVTKFLLFVQTNSCIQYREPSKSAVAPNPNVPAFCTVSPGSSKASKGPQEARSRKEVNAPSPSTGLWREMHLWGRTPDFQYTEVIRCIKASVSRWSLGTCVPFLPKNFLILTDACIAVSAHALFLILVYVYCRTLLVLDLWVSWDHPIAESSCPWKKISPPTGKRSRCFQSS